MLIMMILLFPSILLLAALALASTILLFRSKRLHNIPSRRVQSDSSCQTCHMCGGLRLRTRNAPSFDDSKATQSHIPRLDDTVAGKSKSTQHEWAAMRIQMILSIKQAVQKLINHHKKQARIGFLKKLASLSNFSQRKTSSSFMDVSVVPTSHCNPHCSTGSHSGSSVDGTISDAITIAARTKADKVAAHDTKKCTEIVPQDAPVHRVVLEILVSPTGSAKGNSGTTSPGLSLKLETTGTLEHLAGCLEALKDKDAKNYERNAEISQVSHGATDPMPETLGSGCAPNNKSSQRLDQILKEAILSQKDEINSSGYIDAKLEPMNQDSILDSILLNKGYQALTGFKEHVHFSLAKADILECESAKNVRSSNTLFRNATSDLALQHSVKSKEGSEVASGVALNNLGSLHMSSLKSNGQEENTDVHCQAGSMLASLNVCDKLVSGIALIHMKNEKPNNSCVLSDASCSAESAFIGAQEPEGQETLVKGEDCRSFQGLSDTSFMDNFDSPLKKGKKKKKNRGKKSKGNGDNFVTDAKEMQEIGKIVLQAAKHVSAVSERELGCVCGAMKGNLHNESCPYPFTSSGSMLQRKMREQYNRLVRSNAAKTLTLSQVGQFTSCLVEAKATLRQKSESIQRKFTIAKALLSKADKSSFDRLCGQIYGLEMEQKKLEEDTVVYNRLQEQLKLSPTYQKMLEYGRAHFELQPRTGHMIEKLEADDSELSFEEFLEQEKKDAFWQRHNLARSVMSAR